MNGSSWFEVDRNGLAKVLERRGKAWAVLELIQNGLDAPGTTRIDVTLRGITGSPLAILEVTDNSPDGFINMEHAYTMFAESIKKGDPNLRGRFNIGEKLVLALCRWASIRSTRGTIMFDESGERRFLDGAKHRMPNGTQFAAELALTDDELTEIVDEVRRIIPPTGIEVYVNGEPIKHPELVASSLKANLYTEIASEDGVLRRSKRNTVVHFYRPAPGQPGRLYELGIPVMETGDEYDADVQQKVPLTMERDAVHPSFLRQVHRYMLEATANMLTHQTAAAGWVLDALEDPNIAAETVKAAVEARFDTDKVVAYDPSDREANSLATAQGYQVVHGGTFTKGQWANIKAAGVVLPAGQVTPSPKPFEGGKQIKILAEADYNDRHRRFVQFATLMARQSIQAAIRVKFSIDANWNNKFHGSFGPDGELHVSNSFFLSAGGSPMDHGAGSRRFMLIEFLIHEFGHYRGLDHLGSEYHKSLTAIGASTALWLAANSGVLPLLD